jgi:hypothetical protein
MPGVSITSAPEGVRRRSRWVVVWRLLCTAAEIAEVTLCAVPRRRLMRVDLPTPEEPRKATVRPEVEVVVERGDEEEAVDVGGDDLFGVGV